MSDWDPAEEELPQGFQPLPERPPLSDDEKEAWKYLEEVVGDYERYLSDVDNLGLSAPNLLYYRDEIQDMLDEFKGDPRVDFRGVWLRVKELDEILRANQALVVQAIGHGNFRQYQIMNDPPRTHWWWFMNRTVPPPPPPPPWWMFWKPKPEIYDPLEAEMASAQQEGSDALGVADTPAADPGQSLGGGNP